MNVFMSWSGQRSKEVAIFLANWLQCVIQATKPWISTRDIDRGSLWFNEINDQLKDTTIGIVCLTKENKNKPWILFEAGALAKGLSTSRVCTFLIDLEPSHLENPLAQFNHTLPQKESVLELVKTINSQLSTYALGAETLNQVFNTYWPQFEKQFSEILKNTPDIVEKETRSEQDILAEILDTTRSLNKRLRDVERQNPDNDIGANFFQQRVISPYPVQAYVPSFAEQPTYANVSAGLVNTMPYASGPTGPSYAGNTGPTFVANSAKSLANATNKNNK